MSQSCVLCHHPQIALFLESTHKAWGTRRYFRCDQCQLTFMDPSQHLSFEDERERYALHENNVEDDHYINFLKRLAIPISKRINKGDIGLDYGCGPIPAMNVIFKNLGFQVQSYDPHFLVNTSVLNQQYDFIVCSETAEHFYHPDQEVQKFNELLKSGGVIGVMTLMLNDDINFDQWHYRHDPTHVCFYKKETFEWIADHMKWSLEFPRDNVAIMRKNSHE